MPSIRQEVNKTKQFDKKNRKNTAYNDRFGVMAAVIPQIILCEIERL